MSSRFPITPKGRATKLLSMAASIAKKEAAFQISKLIEKGGQHTRRLQTQLEQARLMVENLKHLKGAAMKAGQLMSLELRDLLPPEVIAILSELHDQGSGLPPDQIRSLIESQISPETLKELEIEWTPFSSASIGQVHRARFKASGVELALKVQFPGIRESIEADLDVLEKVTKGFLAVTFREIETRHIFSEIREILIQETDYLQEAQALQDTQKLVSENLPARLKGRFHVPSVFESISTPTLLAMTLERGIRFDDWIQNHPDRDLRLELADGLLSLYAAEFFNWGLVQTDPNPGNFLFHPNSSSITLLDFGATKRYDAQFKTQYVEFLKAVLHQDGSVAHRNHALQLAFGLELLDPRESPETQAHFFNLVESILFAFRPENQPFDFSKSDYLEETRKHMRTLIGSVRFSPPPRPLLFLHRKLGGIYSMVQSLRVSLDLTPYWPI